MSLKNKVAEFVEYLEGDGEKLFPYMANKGWKHGDNVYYSGPYWDEKEPIAAITTLLEGKWLPAGEEVNKFERAFSKQFGFGHSIMVNSGSSANLVMIAALKKYFDWHDGDEIIVCTCGFPTTINPIIQNGLKPVFVDINYDDLNWDLDQLESKITPRTVALFSSPVLGNPYDFDKFIEIVDRNNLRYIADNCDSLGSKWRGELLTKHAVAASCSFYPAHHISTIEGGMVSSNIEEIVQIARSFAWWGRGCYCVGSQNKLAGGVCGARFDRWLEGYDQDVDHKYVFGVQGYNLKPADLQGSIGLVQLTKQDEIHRIRRSNKARLHEIFSQIPGARVIEEKEHAETSWFGVPIVCDDHKHRLVKYLEDHKVQTRNYFAGNILMHPAYRHIEPARNYPNACKVLDNVFFVGCSPVITEPMLEYIGEVVSNYVSENY
jgi:CDP-6-deoxy-D-xylo-4-hexulose-3-dehydrase|tara:strand:+ start:10681 stop:11982 length:1302 start_codon:yes stop_codon:yes gene_type:complete